MRKRSHRTPPARGVTSSAGAAATESIRLEFLRLEVLAGNALDRYKGWDLYMVLAVEDPTDPSRANVFTFPEAPIDLTNKDKNKIVFGEPGRRKTRDGAEVYFGPMPEDGRISARVHVMQAKDKTRRTGDVLKGVSGALDAAATAAGVAAAGNPYVAAGIAVNKGVGAVGDILSTTEDRSRGWSALDEDFTDADIKRAGQQTHRKEFSGRDVALVYRWSIVATG